MNGIKVIHNIKKTQRNQKNVKNVKSKTIPDTKHLGNLGNHEKVEHKENRNRGRRIPAQCPGNIFNKVIEYFFNLKKDMWYIFTDKWITPF